MTTAYSHLPKDGHRQFGELPTKGELLNTLRWESRRLGNDDAVGGEPPENLDYVNEPPECLGEDESDNDNRETAGEDEPDWTGAGEDESLL